MKAIILAAGRTKTEKKYWFPENSKPKCLFHSGDRTLLERMVSTLKSAGVEDIRIVTGYHAEDIEAYNEENELGLEIVHDPDWGVNGMTSLLVGIRDLDEDVLILMSDVLIYPELIAAFLKSSESLVWIRMKRPWRRFHIYPECRDKAVGVVKVGRERLGIFNDVDCDAIPAIYKWQKSPGNLLYSGIYQAFRHNSPGEVVILTPLREVDRYSETAEVRRG